MYRPTLLSAQSNARQVVADSLRSGVRFWAQEEQIAATIFASGKISTVQAGHAMKCADMAREGAQDLLKRGGVRLGLVEAPKGAER